MAASVCSAVAGQWQLTVGSSEVALRMLGWIFKWSLHHEASLCSRKQNSREKIYLQIMPKPLGLVLGFHILPENFSQCAKQPNFPSLPHFFIVEVLAGKAVAESGKD